jgi:hypothetical protein
MKSYTDLKQSKKLAEILPIESVDMCWTNHCYGNIRSSMTVSTKTIEKYKELLTRFGDLTSIDVFYPCWSLGALLDVIPKHIKDNSVLRIDINENEFAIWYDEVGFGVNNDLPDITSDNPVDACVEMIVKLNDQKLL